MNHSFQILAAEYRPMLVAYLRAMVKDGHLAEDLTQETLIAAQAGISKFEEGASFGKWLRGIARKKALMYWRSAKRKPLVVDSRVVEGIDEVFDGIERNEEEGEWWQRRRDALHECIAALSGQLKAAIEQVYFNTRSLDEAALALGSTRAAIGQRLTRARKGIHGCVTGKLKNGKSDE